MLLYKKTDNLNTNYTANKIQYMRFITPDRRQSKMLLTIDERGSKIARNSVFDSHLSPVGRHIAIEKILF